MAAPDPVDVRLLIAVAETGRAAVHEIAPRLGMDVREVAARLAALSTTGLPLLVGVECDPNGIRNALAAAGVWGNQPGGGQPAPPSGAYPVYPSGPYPAGAPPQPAPNSGAYPVHGGPSGPYPPQGAPSGSHPVHSGRYPAAAPQPAPQQAGPQFPQHSGPFPPAQTPSNTWGPPGSASWARGDQPSAPQRPGAGADPRSGRVGSTLEVEGPDGERLGILLVEVVDPADFLYTAAGYTLRDGERAVVVHTEMTNRAPVSFPSLPDMYLVLVAEDGTAISKSTVSLSSRPPHRIGVPQGETAGGHTVFVLSDEIRLSAVRWTLRPGDDARTLTWDISDL